MKALLLLLFQFSNRFLKVSDFFIIAFMMDDISLKEWPNDKANEHIENEYQEQLKLPVCSILQQGKECFVLHNLANMMNLNWLTIENIAVLVLNHNVASIFDADNRAHKFVLNLIGRVIGGRNNNLFALTERHSGSDKGFLPTRVIIRRGKSNLRNWRRWHKINYKRRLIFRRINRIAKAILPLRLFALNEILANTVAGLIELLGNKARSYFYSNHNRILPQIPVPSSPR